MKKKLRTWAKVFAVLALTVCLVLVLAQSLIFWKDGRDTYRFRAVQVKTMVEKYPDFFATVYDEILPSTLQCELEQELCVQQTRQQFDELSDSVEWVGEPVGRSGWTGSEYFSKPSNHSPMYFIQLQPDGKIAKQFFSGELVLEEVNTREEKMVVELLKGERTELFGLYFDQEAFITGWDPKREWYDPKPAYLKDLYAQMEVIVPYYEDDELIGAIVYLHGE